MMCTTCPHDGYCIPDDCALIEKQFKLTIAHDRRFYNWIQLKMTMKCL